MTAPALDVAPLEGTPVLRTFIELDPHHPVTRGLLVDAHKGHRTTMAPFAYALEQKDFFTGMSTGHADHRSTHNILWAVNHTQPRSRGTGEFAPPPRVRLMIQSDIAPDFSHPLCGELVDAIVGDPSVRRYVPRTAAGSIVEYQINVNPRRNVRSGGLNRTVVARTETEVIDWWVRKSAAAGLSLTGAPVIDQAGETASEKKGMRIRHNRITGKAMITDPVAYAAAAHAGIGAARAYGCGLLLTR